ncbi:hypothetical protein AVEN_274352-1 [Araneus ventricosus]|uniref:Uncharacterized protein n=1 Tax=Araneus ventricosus TaxID=182803 RepID=A0A4Y2G752_ARAVE|nr:hypothetical protein AVEN_274352-1 [Araneus ventricosus]
MQLLDLKTKDLWSGKFTELKSKLEELEVQKCMHNAHHKWTALKEIPRVEALIFGAWNSLPECYSEVADPCPRVSLPAAVSRWEVFYFNDVGSRVEPRLVARVFRGGDADQW